jgi:hypothetical protein
MECLGVKTFKRWWPGEGSFWNAQHIDSSHNNDLVLVIQSAWTKIQHHVGGIMAETILLSLFTMTGYFTSDQLTSYLTATTSYHLLAILINAYNIIRAHRRIQWNDEHPRKATEVVPSELLRIKAVENHLLSGYTVRYNYHDLTPPLPSQVQAEHFRRFVYKTWGQDPFRYERKIFLDQTRALYEAYRDALKSSTN